MLDLLLLVMGSKSWFSSGPAARNLNGGKFHSSVDVSPNQSGNNQILVSLVVDLVDVCGDLVCNLKLVRAIR
jgi:hypothetical protein